METRKEEDEFFVLKIVSLLAALAIIGYLAFGNTAPTSEPSQNTMNQENSSLSSTQLESIQNQIPQLKQYLPEQIDYETTLVDIEFTPPNTMTYYLTLSNSGNWELLTNNLIKTSALSKICSDGNILSTFAEDGINLNFSYSVIDSPQTFFFTFEKGDCPN